MMTDTPKLLTEAEWCRLLAPYGAEEAVQYLGERGLIAPEPVVPLLIEAREIIVSAMDARDELSARDVRAGSWDDGASIRIALAALKRGMELEREARPPLTREMVEAGLMKIGYSWPRLAIDRLHAALTGCQP